MAIQNDVEAFALANTYGFNPPRIISPVRARRLDHGKYEPDHFGTAETRCIVLAHWKDHTNIIIQYNPELNFRIPFHVANGLNPDASGNYIAESGFNDRPTSVGPERKFFIWWDGVDSWIINEQVGHTDNPYWKRTDPIIIGEYDPQDGAVGVATVDFGPV